MPPRWKPQSINNLTTEVTSLNVCPRLFARSQQLSPVPLLERGIKLPLLRGGISKNMWAYLENCPNFQINPESARFSPFLLIITDPATIVCRHKQPLQCSLSNPPIHSPHFRWFFKNVNNTTSFPCLKSSLLWLLILHSHHSLKGHVRSGLRPVIWPDFLSSTHECSRNISLLILL